MKKSDLIEKIAAKFMDIPVQSIALYVNRVIDTMNDVLIKKGRIEIRGFGSFTVHHRTSYKAHNPKTGEYQMSAEKFRPHFKPGKVLRERVDGKKR